MHCIVPSKSEANLNQFVHMHVEDKSMDLKVLLHILMSNAGRY